MSLILPLMINTKTIGCLTISRTEYFGGDGEYNYSWELVMKDVPDLEGRRRPQIAGGTVTHNYEDGAVELIKKVVSELP